MFQAPSSMKRRLHPTASILDWCHAKTPSWRTLSTWKTKSWTISRWSQSHSSPSTNTLMRSKCVQTIMESSCQEQLPQVSVVKAKSPKTKSKLCTMRTLRIWLQAYLSIVLLITTWWFRLRTLLHSKVLTTTKNYSPSVSFCHSFNIMFSSEESWIRKFPL